MSEIARVALDIETALVYGRRVLEGIASYLRANHPWSICLEHHELGQHLGALLKRWNGDGIITRFATKESVALLKKRRIAAIDVGDIEPFLGILKIQSADLLIGRIAAEHLVERGFRSLACCGFTDEHWSQRRRDGFTDEVKRHNLSVSHFDAPRAGQETWKRDQQHLADWITQLPKPLGVFATNDFRAQHVLDACSRLDLAVPETVAVVGVDNDEVVCGFCQPSLTSIIPDAERIGFEAATWLDRIMQGEAPPSSVIEVPPRGIAIRQSSDAYAVSDPLVAAALRYIR